MKEKISQKEKEEWLLETENIALAAGNVLKKYWGKLSSIRQKQFYWDLVTEADTESEQLILSLLQEKFPEHKILSEEAGLKEKASGDFMWVVDPLDGTTNYTHQYPMVAVSIGLLYQQKPLLGVIYNPILNELFKGADGMGAFFNAEPLRVSGISELNKSLLATGFAYDRKETSDNNYAEFCHMTHISQGVRRGGAAALDLAYVAAGRLDGYWERGLKPWDVAAGIVLVNEAGGKVTSYENGPIDLTSGRILATNQAIHAALSYELIKVGKIKPRFTAFT
ncbi:Inositol-1-monophosphatase [Chlamydiales bacterium STE3]|nr:Inositol-1-monophosphatase [Chlamydiales bacterium STE3]